MPSKKVVKYPNTTNAFSDWYAGKMSGEIWGYTSLGIAKTDEEMKEHWHLYLMVAKIN